MLPRHPPLLPQHDLPADRGQARPACCIVENENDRGGL